MEDMESQCSCYYHGYNQYVNDCLVSCCSLLNPRYYLAGALVVGYSWIGRPDATVHTTWPPGQGYIVRQGFLQILQ